ncbi:MerR family transcriptional regulator [Ciceribacter sp. L1K22]|uniref:MerR family transcriptional regulator n=1 Tax=Ciceribacter sp. L1K22 TaxID=2820275 RepID=UPI001ABE1F58|nr:MerR family transcriptional regulator [Ciceribacter sp. L1K22]MBO3759476.1 MerR family transcriptional regulator [Ciceribacter sp. L1K22]
MRNDILEDTWLTAAQCAKRVGLTVRALRLYEETGLIHPRRTDANWRLYGAREIARLNEILMLKRLGLSLQHIARLLAGQAADLDRMLHMQNLALRERLARTQHSLAIIDALRAKTAAGVSISVEELLQLAKDTLMTDTSLDDIAWRRYDQARPRKEMKIEPALYADYEGYYALDHLAYVVTNRDGRLLTRISGQPELEIFPEDVDQFFYRAVQAQITFVREHGREVTGLVLHQYGFDHDAPRIEPERGIALERAFADRIAQNQPIENGEALLRLVIQDLLGEPDYKLMTPELACIAREQSETAGPFLRGMGTLRDLKFKKVTEQGWDLYEAAFDNGHLYWSFILNDDQKVSGLFYQKSPED